MSTKSTERAAPPAATPSVAPAIGCGLASGLRGGRRLARSVLIVALSLVAACGQEDPFLGIGGGGLVEKGMIFVSSSVDSATITLDGLSTGLVTPDTLREVSVGMHEVRVFKACFAQAVEDVEVLADSLHSVHLELELSPENGSIAVTSPLPAAIFLDGADTGCSTPDTLTCVAPGEYRVTLSLLGFRSVPVEQLVLVTADEVADAPFDLAAPKVVVCEDFSNFACLPCPAADAALQAAMGEFEPEEVVSVNPHVFWPGAGDPMYLFNRPANDARIILNQVSSAPTIAVGGATQLTGNAAQSSDAIRDAVAADLVLPAPLAIGVRATLGATDLRVTVDVWGIAGDLPSDLLLFTCVVEREVTLEPPGPNNQSHYTNVLRHLFPTPEAQGVGGEAIGDLAPNEKRTFAYTYELPAAVDADQLAVIAFAQRRQGDRRIHQTGMSFRP